MTFENPNPFITFTTDQIKTIRELEEILGFDNRKKLANQFFHNKIRNENLTQYLRQLRQLVIPLDPRNDLRQVARQRIKEIIMENFALHLGKPALEKNNKSDYRITLITALGTIYSIAEGANGFYAPFEFMVDTFGAVLTNPLRFFILAGELIFGLVRTIFFFTYEMSMIKVELGVHKRMFINELFSSYENQAELFLNITSSIREDYPLHHDYLDFAEELRCDQSNNPLVRKFERSPKQIRRDNYKKGAVIFLGALLYGSTGFFEGWAFMGALSIKLTAICAISATSMVSTILFPALAVLVGIICCAALLYVFKNIERVGLSKYADEYFGDPKGRKAEIKKNVKEAVEIHEQNLKNFNQEKLICYNEEQNHRLNVEMGALQNLLAESLPALLQQQYQIILRRILEHQQAHLDHARLTENWKDYKACLQDHHLLVTFCLEEIKSGLQTQGLSQQQLMHMYEEHRNILQSEYISFPEQMQRRFQDYKDQYSVPLIPQKPFTSDFFGRRSEAPADLEMPPPLYPTVIEDDYRCSAG